MAPYLVEVRNHTRKQIFVVTLPSALAPRERLTKHHAQDTPGWDYGTDDIEFIELAVVEPTPSVSIFVRAYVRTRKIKGWRILVAASLRADRARTRAQDRKRAARKPKASKAAA